MWMGCQSSRTLVSLLLGTRRSNYACKCRVCGPGNMEKQHRKAASCFQPVACASMCPASHFAHTQYLTAGFAALVHAVTCSMHPWSGVFLQLPNRILAPLLQHFAQILVQVRFLASSTGHHCSRLPAHKSWLRSHGAVCEFDG